MSDDVARIAKGLTKAQRDWLLSLPADMSEMAITESQWDQMLGGYVDLSNDADCPDRRWLWRVCASSPAHSSTWSFRASASPTGLAVRAYLENNDG